VSHQDTLGHQTTSLVRGLFWTNACSVRPCSNLKRYVCEVSALYRCQVHSHAICASVHCTISIPDLAVQGFADGDCSGDVIIPRPGHHNLCVALTCVAVLHLHRQTCSAMRVNVCQHVPADCRSYMVLHITCTDRLTSTRVFLGACSCTM